MVRDWILEAISVDGNVMRRVGTTCFNDLKELLWAINATNRQLVEQLHCKRL